MTNSLRNMIALCLFGVSAMNLVISKSSNDLANLVLATGSESGDGSAWSGWTDDVQTSTHTSNGVVYKESEVTNCYENGPLSSCTPGCKYRLKLDNDTWDIWRNC